MDGLRVVYEPVAEVEGGDKIGAVLLHHRDGRIVDIRSVFDGIHARLSGETPSLGAVPVCRTFSAETMRVCYRGLHLFQRVLRSLRIVALGEHAAGGADLDEVSAIFNVLAH